MEDQQRQLTSEVDSAVGTLLADHKEGRESEDNEKGQEANKEEEENTKDEERDKDENEELSKEEKSEREVNSGEVVSDNDSTTTLPSAKRKQSFNDSPQQKKKHRPIVDEREILLDAADRKSVAETIVTSDNPQIPRTTLRNSMKSTQRRRRLLTIFNK